MHCWQYLCFIPDIPTMATNGISPEGKMQLYQHPAFMRFWRRFCISKRTPRIIKLRLGNKIKCVGVIIPASCLCDGWSERNDHVCGQTGEGVHSWQALSTMNICAHLCMQMIQRCNAKGSTQSWWSTTLLIFVWLGIKKERSSQCSCATCCLSWWKDWKHTTDYLWQNGQRNL